jgi:hypothetical protein
MGRTTRLEESMRLKPSLDARAELVALIQSWIDGEDVED